MNFFKTYGKPLLCTALTALLIAIPNQAKAEENPTSKSEPVVTNSAQANTDYQKKLAALNEKILKFDKLADEKIAKGIYFDSETVTLEKELLKEIEPLNTPDKLTLKKEIERIHAKIENHLENYRREKYYKSLNLVSDQVNLYSLTSNNKMTNRNILNEARAKGIEIDEAMLNKLEYSDKINLLNKINNIETRLNEAEKDITDVENEIEKYAQDVGEVYIISKYTRPYKPNKYYDDLTDDILKLERGEKENLSVEKEVLSITDKNTNKPFIGTNPKNSDQLVLLSENDHIDKDKYKIGQIGPIPLVVEGSFEEINVQFSKDEACMDTTIKVIVEEESFWSK